MTTAGCLGNLAGTCEVWSTVLSGALIEVMTLLTDAVAVVIKMLSVTMDLPLLLVVLNGTLISATGTVRTY